MEGSERCRRHFATRRSFFMATLRLVAKRRRHLFEASSGSFALSHFSCLLLPHATSRYVKYTPVPYSTAFRYLHILSPKPTCNIPFFVKRGSDRAIALCCFLLFCFCSNRELFQLLLRTDTCEMSKGPVLALASRATGSATCEMIAIEVFDRACDRQLTRPVPVANSDEEKTWSIN